MNCWPRGAGMQQGLKDKQAQPIMLPASVRNLALPPTCLCAFCMPLISLHKEEVKVVFTVIVVMQHRPGSPTHVRVRNLDGWRFKQAFHQFGCCFVFLCFYQSAFLSHSYWHILTCVSVYVRVHFSKMSESLPACFGESRTSNNPTLTNSDICHVKTCFS